MQFSDYVTPNNALANGDIDLNAFQHRIYLQSEIESYGYAIQNIGNTFIIPLNLYSQKVSSVDELKDGDVVAIPDDLTNGARALKEVPYMDEFLEIQREFPNFKFHLALDRPDPQADAAGVKYTPGFVHNVLYENYLKNHQAPEDNIYLMCGPPMMISSVVKMLDSLGVPSENILYDNFGS